MRCSPLMVIVCALGCSVPPNAPDDTPDVPDEETSPPEPDDTDVNPVADSDVPFDPGTVTDTATAHLAPATVVTPQDIHQARVLAGERVRVNGLVVTARRDCRIDGCPPASNGFMAQDPLAIENGGIYVDLKDSQQVPSVGTIVDIIGQYKEWPGLEPSQLKNQSRLIVHPSIPDTDWIHRGVTLVPAALPIDIDDIDDAATAERYESMLVLLAPADRLFATDEPTPAGVFSLTAEGASGAFGTAKVAPTFFDARTIFTIEAGHSVYQLTGVVDQLVADYRIAPRYASDLNGFSED